MCVVYVSKMLEPRNGLQGREVKGEVENENGDQTNKDFGFHSWVAACS